MYELEIESYKIEKYFDVRKTDNLSIFDFYTDNTELFDSIKKISKYYYYCIDNKNIKDMNIILYSEDDERYHEKIINLRKNLLLILTFDSEETALYISMKYFM